ncbi:nucleotidyltransferase family protein [Oceanivirga miroungae]|uniref:tRNA(Met) cytidine acetate ligase n=1 Tax=Oceanivirga miroungae TaxID=1130046 RepID=A0A6I8MBH3_9FUSO|nr:nucleotidyltransferase family protein [Oceanivirga miroungae]VWL84767.1 cytidyltransferase-related domain-containing protein [Oceanivirga miroungae]
MNVIGVVAEFNPFHNGHKYQVEMIKKLYNPDILIALISNNFVQRAELSILNEEDKVNIALSMGYDIVIEIPPQISIQNAEVYCENSVRILDKIGCNIQVFGAETEDINILDDLIDKLKDEDIKKYTSLGHSYNKACFMVLEKYGLSKYYTSNNILALEYIRAKKKYNLDLSQKIIKRVASGYNDETISNNISSATNIRNLIKNGKNYENLVPYKSSKLTYILEKEDMIFDLFKYIFLRGDIDSIYDLSDELKNYISNRIRKAKNYEEFLEISKNRNISINRIKRIMLNVILNIKDVSVKEIEYIKVLGINKKGAKYIKNLDFCYVNYKHIKEDVKYEEFLNYLKVKKTLRNSIYREDL